MTNWHKVIERLQVEFVAPSQGHFFQLSNPEWTTVQPGMDTPMATHNADSTSLNVQVISANINRVYEFLRQKLHLQLRHALSIKVGEEFQPLNNGMAPTIQLLRTSENTRVVQVLFSGVSSELPNEDIIRLTVEPSIDWKAGLFSGARKLSPSNVERDRSYVHEHYEDIARYVAIFEVPFPAAKVGAEAFELQLTATFPDIDNTSPVTTKGKLNVVLSH